MAYLRARKNTQRSLAIYSDLIKEFSQTNWTAVEAQLLRQTIALREGTTNQVDRTERLLSVLALIRTGLTTGSLKWTLDTTDADGRETAGSLLEEARKLSRQFDKGKSNVIQRTRKLLTYLPRFCRGRCARFLRFACLPLWAVSGT